VILVGGALDDGAENASLADALAAEFTVINYNRRGRSESGDTLPYDVQREIEDLAALISIVGGTCCRRVAQHPLNALDVGARRHGQARGGVPQLVGGQTQPGPHTGPTAESARVKNGHDRPCARARGGSDDPARMSSQAENAGSIPVVRSTSPLVSSATPRPVCGKRSKIGFSKRHAMCGTVRPLASAPEQVPVQSRPPSPEDPTICGASPGCVTVRTCRCWCA
jgi:hypothetical protein